MTDNERELPTGPLWRITVEVPASAPNLDGLFTAVADAVHEWEPAVRDSWDADVHARVSTEGGNRAVTDNEIWVAIYRSLVALNIKVASLSEDLQAVRDHTGKI